MGICIATACGGCPEWIVALAWVGGALIYAIIGALIFAIIKSFKDDIDFEFIIMCIIAWPLIIICGIVVAIFYYVGGYLFRLFALPIIAVDKHDLKVSEDRIIDKIDTKITREDNKIMDYLENDYVQPKRAKKVEKSVKDKTVKDKTIKVDKKETKVSKKKKAKK